MRRRIAAAVLLFALIAVPAGAAPAETAGLIEGVKGIEGPETVSDALQSAMNAGLDAKLPEHYLEGFSGIAAPVFNRVGRVDAAVSVSGPS